ncbi:hypothetical protein CMI47_20685 [Candidatus Pacearchaeota archaeon]|nr:hypothetical protein [Candidatus Pacearchaeota archaeon]
MISKHLNYKLVKNLIQITLPRAVRIDRPKKHVSIIVSKINSYKDTPQNIFCRQIKVKEEMPMLGLLNKLCTLLNKEELL